MLLNSSHLVFYNPKNDIKNTVKRCRDCKHYTAMRRVEVHKKMDEEEYATCNLFGHVNLITGRDKPMLARVARGENTMCGKEGIYYEPIMEYLCFGSEE
jgi:hypothetical protein